MDSIRDKTGIIRITNTAPKDASTIEVLRALFAYGRVRRDDEFTEVVFRNRRLTPIADTEVIITHRTPDPMTRVQIAFREAWARLNANQRLRIVIRFEIGGIDE